MAIKSAPTFTAEQLLERAVGNYLELVYATLEFLKEKRIPIPEYARSIGLRHADTWSTGVGALELAEEMARNMQSVGATLDEVTGDGSQARLVVSDWPPAGYERYAVDAEDIDEFVQLLEPIAERNACAFRSSREDSQVLMTFTRME